MKRKLIFKANDSWHLFEFSSRNYKTGTIKEIFGRIKKEDHVYSMQVSDFIREFDKEYIRKNLPILIDVESFVKQFWQKSSPLSTQKKWNFFKFLKENKYLPKEFKIQDSIFDYLGQIAAFIEDTTINSSPEELRRFEEIEIPINKLIYQRQRRGIQIDESIYLELIKTTEENLYGFKNELQLNHNIYSPDKISTQVDILASEGIEIKGSILTIFKSNRSHSEICMLFYNMLRAKNDLSALLYLTAKKGGESRTYPNYYGFGSISSRITLREPALQNLTKSARRVLKPDKESEFIYVDYSQFEAGILASLSNDSKLQKLYDSDIYDDINKNVWGGEKNRGEGKILFYKYMYGIQFRKSKESSYFNSFIKLTKYREEIEGLIKSKGKVGSSFGNVRILDSEDKTIALSHRIQSEASLIFKCALLRISKEIPEVDFVLPMHDAALYQLNTKIHDKRYIEEKIKMIFKNVFASKCSGINHSVKIKDFYLD